VRRVPVFWARWQHTHGSVEEVIRALRRELPIIVLVVPPTTPREVLGIDAQAVVAAVSHHVIPRQSAFIGVNSQ
jgi:hypothetical protein